MKHFNVGDIIKIMADSNGNNDNKGKRAVIVRIPKTKDEYYHIACIEGIKLKNGEFRTIARIDKDRMIFLQSGKRERPFLHVVK